MMNFIERQLYLFYATDCNHLGNNLGKQVKKITNMVDLLCFFFLGGGRGGGQNSVNGLVSKLRENTHTLERFLYQIHENDLA